MPDYFTHAEAERLVARVRTLIEQLRNLDYDRIAASEETDRICRNVALNGGMISPRQRLADLKLQHERLIEQAQSVLDQIQTIGCEVKDLEKGLVDFPTLYRGQMVYLCWKLGEEGILYWHTPEDGFRGRRRIDDEFLAHHRGGLPH
jgi:hypothetical protein